MNTTEKISEFIDTSALSRRLAVTPMTISRWRRLGYLPEPCYASGNCTLWRAAEIEKWEADGSKWQDKQRAKQLLASMGSEAVNEQLKPEPWTENPDSRAVELANAAERLLNDSEKFVQRAEELKLEIIEYREMILKGMK